MEGITIINYGCNLPSLTSVVKKWCKDQNDGELIVEIAKKLWNNDGEDNPCFDMRLACVKLLRTKVNFLPTSFLGDFESFLITAQTWALIDELAMHVAPKLLADDEEAILNRWSTHENCWVRRTCLLAHSVALKSPGGGNWDRFSAFASGMLDEKVFWIRKAIGWVLRDVSKKRPELVSSFLAENIDRISGITWKEAVKYLPAADVQTLKVKRSQ